MRVRLREYPDHDELNQLYPEPHDAWRYGYGHSLRVKTTIDFTIETCGQTGPISTVADLSAGNCAIPEAVAAHFRASLWLGDYAANDKKFAFRGPIETTIHQLAEQAGTVDVFVLSETVEHLQDPDALLALIPAKQLILSTPIGETDQGNPEHIWGWDQNGVDELLSAAGWTPAQRLDLILPDTYSYQVWRATR